jgi:L-fuculose-phosphate aldolase
VHYAITNLGGPVRVARYVRFGSAALAEAAVAALAGRQAAILQNHGAICYGATLPAAYNRAVLLEWLATVYRLARAHGDPRILSQAELDEVAAEARRRRYGERRSR